MDKRAALIDQLPHLMRYARALKRDTDAADDLVQDCVHRALSRLHLFQAGTNMRAWLFTILHNIHVQDVRKQARAVDRTAFEDGFENRQASEPEQMGQLTARDLERALDRLSDEQRAVVLLVGLEDMSYREAADILGVPVGTVMSRLARGRERLRRIMDGEGEPLLRSVT
jgi:RNA polymerase sigma-70 factor (ECF subfamily)